MTTRRSLLIALGAGALAAPLRSFAQPRSRRIGYLDLGSRQSLADTGRYATFLQGMRELGRIKGKDFFFEARFADGSSDRLDGLAADLVRLKVDVIVTFGTPASHAAQRATSTIPIVVVATSDPVLDGLAESLARPGGNITGLSTGATDIVQKHVELLISMAAKLSRVAVLLNPANGAHPPLLLRTQTALQHSGRQVVPISARPTAGDIDGAFAALARAHADALILLPDSSFFQAARQIAGLAVKHRLPSIASNSTYAEAGLLMSYGGDIIENFRRAVIFVDKILKGANPGELPFEQPTRYFLVINGKTAKAIGVTVPPEFLRRADRVIE